MRIGDRVVVQRAMMPLVFVLKQTQRARIEPFTDTTEAVPVPLDGPWFDRFELREVTTGTSVEFMMDATLPLWRDDEAVVRIAGEYARKIEQRIVEARAVQAVELVKAEIRGGALALALDADTYSRLRRDGIDVDTVMVVTRNGE